MNPPRDRIRCLAWLMFGLLILVPSGISAADATELSLAGSWGVRLDPKDECLSRGRISPDTRFQESITLPGTTDEAGLGDRSAKFPAILDHQVLKGLQRKVSFEGPVLYCRTISIPASWADKPFAINLERVQWESRVWLDGVEVGMNDGLSTPHRFEIPSAKPGNHELVIRIDNRPKIDIGRSHARAEDTQTCWNGMVGKITMESLPPVRLDSIWITPDTVNPSARIHLLNSIGKTGKGSIRATLSDGTGATLLDKTMTVTWDAKEGTVDLPLGTGAPLPLWDEFHPNLLSLDLRLEGDGGVIDRRKVRFGLRQIKREGQKITLNGHEIFLRGTHEGCSFPLTGYPPMDVASWRRVFKTLKSWGLNHMRFHSYCPPEACFTAADEEGIYLQIELPLWAGGIGAKGDDKRVQWIRKEAEQILTSYGNHPSMLLVSLGNELHGEFPFLQKLVEELKKIDPRHLYTMTSNRLYAGVPKQEEHQPEPILADDFEVERAVTLNGRGVGLRGQSYFNGRPNTVTDFSPALAAQSLPVITHEVGQWNIFPNLAEIPKYTGVLRPANLEAIRESLATNGLLAQAADFTRASGKYAAELYKEEVELALRSHPLAGFQLLDLHDYPGQGTAHIGLLDSFWDSKGVATPEWFRQACGPVTPLLRIPKRVYTTAEIFSGELEMANFSGHPFDRVAPVWRLSSATSGVIGSGTLSPVPLPIGAGTKAGTITLPLDTVTSPCKATLTIAVPEAGATNSWNVWIVPPAPPLEAPDVLVTGSLREAEVRLGAGGKVLFTPPRQSIRQRQDTGFLPSFWSPVYFTNQTGTMGLLIQKDHAALASFPTDEHCDWQWWSILTPSPGAVILNQVKLGKPIVQVIDSFARNRLLGLVFEARVGKGHLVVCSADLTGKGLDDPMRRQLRSSLVSYLHAAAPEAIKGIATLSEEDLSLLFCEAGGSPSADSHGQGWAKDLEPPSSTPSPSPSGQPAKAPAH